MSYVVLPYPLENARELAPGWISFVIARNVVTIWILYGGWHWVLYVSVLRERMRPLKYNAKNLSSNGDLNILRGYNPWHDASWATSGAVIESLYECLVLHLWASGRVPYLEAFWSTPMASLAWLMFVNYWRDFHFFFAHRIMHPYFGRHSKWKNWDLGRFLYRHVHKLHHRSYNTGPWSGLSMHPVEHLIYFSCVFLPTLFVPQHPIHFLFNHWHVLVSPLPGHDGFEDPGGGGHIFTTSTTHISRSISAHRWCPLTNFLAATRTAAASATPRRGPVLRRSSDLCVCVCVYRGLGRERSA